MKPGVIILFAIAVLVVLIIWAIRYGKKRRAKKTALYKEMALQLSLNYVETKKSFSKMAGLEGTWKGNEVNIFERIVSSGNSQQTYTIIQFPNSPFDFKFKIGKEHFFSKIGRAVGLKDIEFDQFELDQKFLFKSKDEERFRALMNYKLLHQLEETEKAFRGTIVNDKGKMEYTQSGEISQPEQADDLVEVLTFMTSLLQA